MNGAGNDFIVIDNRIYQFSHETLAGLALRFCRRRFGIGADGLLALSKPTLDEAQFRMSYYNADGSLGTMCGNGARCLARFARNAGINECEMTFESDAGMIKGVVPEQVERPVCIFFNPPERFTPNMPLKNTLAGAPRSGHFIWTGTPHLVCYVENTETTPVSQWGPAIRSDEAFGNAGANVDFAQLIIRGDTSDRARFRVRTFEKGVEDETYACGTGAIAVAVVSRLQGLVYTNTVDIDMPGGTLAVGFVYEDNKITNLSLEGPADTVYQGYIMI